MLLPAVRRLAQERRSERGLSGHTSSFCPSLLRQSLKELLSDVCSELLAHLYPIMAKSPRRVMLLRPLVNRPFRRWYRLPSGVRGRKTCAIQDEWLLGVTRYIRSSSRLDCVPPSPRRTSTMTKWLVAHPRQSSPNTQRTKYPKNQRDTKGITQPVEMRGGSQGNQFTSRTQRSSGAAPCTE